MPKIYTPQEKDQIRKALRREGARCLRLYGVKRTTVDELVTRAGIPKGTFYLFYPHKEALFYDLLLDFSNGLEDAYLEKLQELDENHIVTSLTDIFLDIAMEFHKRGLHRFLDGNELELVTRRMGETAQEELAAKRRAVYRTLFEYFYIDDEEDIASFTEGFSAIHYIMLYEDKVTDLEKTLRYLIRGLVLQMVE